MNGVNGYHRLVCTFFRIEFWNFIARRC